jgi:hypothetical protein
MAYPRESGRGNYCAFMAVAKRSELRVESTPTEAEPTGNMSGCKLHIAGFLGKSVIFSDSGSLNLQRPLNL